MDLNQVNLNLFLSYLQNSNFPQNPNIQNSQSSNSQTPNPNPNFQIPNFFPNPNFQIPSNPNSWSLLLEIVGPEVGFERGITLEMLLGLITV